MAIKGADGNTSQAATTATTEAVFVTVGPIDVPADSTRALVMFFFNIFGGAGVTTCQARLRRGTTITDTEISNTSTGVMTQAANTNVFAAISALDALAGAATVAYCGTITAAGGTITNKSSSVFVLFV